MGRNDVETVNMDQCQLGGDDGKGSPLKKPTKFMSNGLEILDALRRRCAGRGGFCSRRGGGKHALCSGMVARRAATYPFRLCRSILEGFRKQLMKDGVIQPGTVGMHYVGEDGLEDERARSEVAHVLSVGATNTRYYDDLTKQPLREDLVKAAIAK